jgi:5-methylcytosine-specific restriction endonuclease McrA
MTYEEYLQSDEWKARATAAKERDGNRCRLCNSPDNLNAHHRTYERAGDEDPDDLTTLCKWCHTLYSAAVHVLAPTRGELRQPAPPAEVVEIKHTPEQQRRLDAIKAAEDAGDKEKRARLVMEYLQWQRGA